MFTANLPGNRNCALSYRHLSPDSSGINTRAGQSGQTTAVADNISFSTATVGSMMLYVGKTITALSEYEKLLLSTVLAPDTEKKPCSALPDNNGIYSWLVNISQYRSSHLLHDAPEQVMVTSALDSSLSCIHRIMISDLSSQHSQLHCDASFDWTESHHPQVPFNAVLHHPGQVSFQELVCLKETMMEHTAMNLEELQYPDNTVQHQHSRLADPQFLVADDQQADEVINGIAEIPSFHNVSPCINNHDTTRQEALSLDHKGTGLNHSFQLSAPTFRFDEVSGTSNLIKGKLATAKEIEEHIGLMFSEGKMQYPQIRESLHRAGLRAGNSRIKEIRDTFYQTHDRPDKLPKASDAKIIEHIQKVSGRCINAVMQSIRQENLRVNQAYATRLLYKWREENRHTGRKKSASTWEIRQHIERVSANGRPNGLNVLKSLHSVNLGASSKRVSPLLTEYLLEQERKQNSSE